MTAREIVFNKLKLRTHPFLPEIGPDDAPLPSHLVAKALDPSKDARLLSYYFNVYDWRNSSIVGGLSRQDALENFPQREDLRHEGPILILVSGTGQTGRGSLINLILYKISLIRHSRPIIVDTLFSSLDKKQNVKEMARLFINTYTIEETQPSADKLWQVYERETKEKSTGGDAHYTTLFSSLRLFIRQSCDRPIAFLIRGGDHYDLWACIYNSSVALADYLIVETSKAVDAVTCNNRMTAEGKNVAHIDAMTLDFETAMLYVRDRLYFERPAGMGAEDKNDLSPFTENAIRVLYARGTDPRATAAVRHPIGWLRETLRRALKEHLDDLSKVVESKGKEELDNLPPETVLLDAERIWKVRQNMNQGR